MSLKTQVSKKPNKAANNTDLEALRKKLSELRLEREAIILEKGLLAQDNNDLRENFAYGQYEQKEHALTSKIHAIMNEIYELSKK